MSFIAWIIIAVVLVAIFVVLAASFYTRATNEVALVKTGVGGRRVVIDGGTIAIPFFHEISRVNMQTLRMSVECRGEDSLITQDRLRVDVGAEFYVSVATTPEDVTKAAQTLGKRVFQADQLKSLLDGMLVDALRAEAAKVTLDALHENRGVFSANVKEALAEAASGYGLNVNAVSLVSLDQTPFAALDENNAFNAVGMRKLAEVIATSRKERAEINSSADVSVTQAEMEAHKRKLEIELEQRRAEIGQAQEVETLLAQQVAEIAERKAESERTKAHARITMEEAIQTAEIARERNLEIAERDRAIKLAAKSQEESKAETAAAVSRTEAVKAAEAVRTAEALDIAEREKSLALMAAEKEAQAAAARARISAESEKVTAADLRAAREEEANALKSVEMARVAVEEAQIKAQNGRSEAIIAMELEQSRLEAMPKIVAEMVRPAEKIKGISINQISGIGEGKGSSEAAQKSPIEAAVGSILDMAVQAPALRKIGDAIGDSLQECLSEKDTKSVR